MQKENSRQGRSLTGPMFAVFLVAIVLISSWLFLQRWWWLPELASAHGVEIDRVFLVTLVITGVLFIFLQLILAFFSFRYRERQGRPALYWIQPRIEKRFALIAGIIILGVDITLYALGERQWFTAWESPPADAQLIEVTAEQFMWNFRYPGKDGVLARTDPQLVSPSNTLGIDRNDPASKDDVLSINQLHLPENRPVRLRLRSKDVIHSFFLPNLRVKQDVVPGMQIEISFRPVKAGHYEIACTQLCGMMHYRMRAALTVESQAEFDKWLASFNQEEGGS
jgi:cytochrome c oxidase subunit 2